MNRRKSPSYVGAHYSCAVAQRTNSDGLSVGARVRDRRKQLGLSQRDLAERVGIGYPHLSKIEGGVETPSDELIRNLARELDEDVDEMMALAQRVTPDLAQLVIDENVARAFLRRVREGDISINDVERFMNRQSRRD